MYVSETIKEQLRPYDGQAIEIDALEVFQPINPGDGLIRRLRVLGPAPPNRRPFTFDGIKLDAQPVAVKGSRAAIELTVTNDTDATARIDSSEIGFVLLSEKLAGDDLVSDGPSTAVITRTNLFRGKAEFRRGGETGYSYSYLIPETRRLPELFELEAHRARSTLLRFDIPAGHYQFFAGYGGGVHESRLVVSNPVSIELW